MLASIGVKRDFFLTLPTHDWCGSLELEASYADRRAMSMHLCQQLRNTDATLLFDRP